ncbi:MAG: hypothetical protein JWN48_724 [Myxococcaceae bacterium]|nr:hypothetical protein [Myxococcaceae bacterium]
MTNILDPGSFELEEVRAVLHGMIKVAAADGDDKREVALIGEFLAACRPDVQDQISLVDLRHAPFDAARARAALSTKPLQQTFVASCLLVAYCDGRVSAPEQAAVATLTDELAIDAETLAATQQRVESLLVSRVAQISDLEALRTISGRM